MTPLEILALAVFGAAALAAGVAALAVLRGSRRSAGAAALGRGDFEEAARAADTSPTAGREDLYVAAVAAKHRLDLADAAALLERILAADPGDGDAWLERGLVAGYLEDYDGALAAFARAEALRSDLAEPLALHRAWALLRRGERLRALRIFDEIEAPLETKLLSDLGPGDPLFAEWFLQAAALWQARGDADRAAWARRAGLAAGPQSHLLHRLA